MSWHRYLAAGCLLATVAGCAEKPSTTPDNTAVNQRDQSGNTMTPIDQNENQADIDRTAEIRKQVVANSALSTNAHNVKIITQGGKVTLRGPVDSAAERDDIVRIATSVAGATNVDNQLEVTTK